MYGQGVASSAPVIAPPAARKPMARTAPRAPARERRRPRVPDERPTAKPLEPEGIGGYGVDPPVRGDGWTPVRRTATRGG